MKRFVFQLGLVIVLILISVVSFAQNKEIDKLRNNEKKLSKEIQFTNKLISETKSERRNSLKSISLLNNKINHRKSLIQNLTSQINIIEQDIIQTKTQTSILKADLIDLKKEYASLIRESYKSRHQLDKWVFILASDDFYQAYKRLKYLQKYNEYRRQRAKLIEEKTKELNKLIVELEEARDNHIEALVLKENETRLLENDKVQKTRVAQSLKSKESELLAKLSKQKLERNKLQNQIQDIIEKLTAEKGDKTEGILPLTPEQQLISDNFEQNKGKLPWPVARGQITEKYGKRQHPDLKNVSIDNKGINISCQKDEIVRSVFDGVVVEVLQLPKSKAVLIRHGNYYTLYNHLSEVFVVKGQNVKTKTKLGVVSTDPNTNETDLQFQVWKSRETQNPEYWITKW